MTESSLLYGLPLRVALPPLNDSFDQNINMDMDKKMCKELNLSEDSSPTTNTTASTNNNKTTKASTTNAKDAKPNNNEETDGSISMTSSEKQEWSVTLYDVDRKGNVSEEDLARLVTMLYKAAGSSITVPQEGQGTKKIKLRLSVAPDQSHTKVYIQKPTATITNCSDSSNKEPQTHSNTQPPTSQEQTQSSPFQQPASSRKDRKPHRSHKYPSAHPAPQNNSNTDGTGSGGVALIDFQSKENFDGKAHSKSYSHRKRSKKRHSRTQSADNNNSKHKHHSRSAERKINAASEEQGGPVMENMDRRQYYKDLVGIENETLQSLELEERPTPHYHHNITAPAALLLKCGGGEKSQVIDLKSQTVFLPNPKDKYYKSRMNRIGKQVHFEGRHQQAVGYNNPAFVSGNLQCNKISSKSKSHSKSRPKSCGPVVGGNDLLQKDAELFLNSEGQFIDGYINSDIEKDGKSLNVLLTSSTNTHPTTPAAVKTLPSTNLLSPPLFISSSPPQLPTKNETTSPHHMRRHRNREQEYNRSMKQVAEWIQRQHTYVAAATAAVAAANTSPPPEPVVHQHHHIHEHHHHYHFYHYYET